MDFGRVECLPWCLGGKWWVWDVCGDHLAPWHAWMMFSDGKIVPKRSKQLFYRDSPPPAPCGKWDQVGADLMTRNRNPGQGQPTVKTSSTDTRDHRKLKWRIGEGFIAEISERDTFEKPAPMETGLLVCFTKRSTGNCIRKCKSENFVFGCLCSDLPVPDGCSPSQGVSKRPLRF